MRYDHKNWGKIFHTSHEYATPRRTFYLEGGGLHTLLKLQNCAICNIRNKTAHNSCVFRAREKSFGGRIDHINILHRHNFQQKIWKNVTAIAFQSSEKSQNLGSPTSKEMQIPTNCIGVFGSQPQFPTHFYPTSRPIGPLHLIRRSDFTIPPLSTLPWLNTVYQLDVGG